MTKKEKKHLFETIGFQIRKLRLDADLSQEALGELVQKSRTSIVNIELGRQHPPLDLLIDISACLHVPLQELIGESVWSKNGNTKLDKVKESLLKEKSDKDISKVIDLIDEINNPESK